jgi:cytochrome c oxidase subunit 2
LVMIAVVAGSCGSKPEPNAPDPKLVAEGEALHGSKGCVMCHSVDGTPAMGPTMAGLYGKTQELTDGRSVVADGAYMRRAILEPQAEVVVGYLMPMRSYKGMLSEREIEGLIAYYRSLGEAP